MDFFTVFWYNLKDSQPFKGLLRLGDSNGVSSGISRIKTNPQWTKIGRDQL